MKKKIILILIIVLLLTGCNLKKNKDPEVNLYLFYLSTCPHCHAEMEWLDSIKEQYDYLNIIKFEAHDNMNLYKKVLEKMNISNYNVPLTIIGNDYIIGFEEYKKDDIEKLIEKYSKFENCDLVDTIKNDDDINKCMTINDNN